MPRFSDSIDIACSPEQLFAYVADLRNEPTWHKDLASVPESTPAVPAVGSSYPVTFKPFMGKTEGTYATLEVVPGSRIVHRANLVGLSGMQVTLTYLVEPTAAGSRFTRASTIELGGIKRLMSPMMMLMFPKANRGFLANLKRALEV